MDVSWVVAVGAVMVAGVALVVLSTNSMEQAKLNRRLAAIERRLGAVMDQLGVVEERPELPKVLDALGRGKKIEAIKHYRAETKADLVEAKNAVEEIARQHGL